VITSDLIWSEHIHLRSPEPSDAHLIMLWENNPENWQVTDTEIPFSLNGILELIDNQRNFRSTGQLRLLICLNDSDTCIGTIDLYDADFKNMNVAIGILIGDKLYRGLGYAKEALNLMINYTKEVFNFDNIYCSIQATNKESIHLFEGSGFEQRGIRKNWFKTRNGKVDELMYQLCLEK
jgi:diamine N-acetyltransferase